MNLSNLREKEKKGKRLLIHSKGEKKGKRKKLEKKYAYNQGRGERAAFTSRKGGVEWFENVMSRKKGEAEQRSEERGKEEWLNPANKRQSVEKEKGGPGKDVLITKKRKEGGKASQEKKRGSVE